MSYSENENSSQGSSLRNPSGDEQAWRERYQPYLKSFRRNRTVDSPLVSAIVLTYKPNPLLLECLRALNEQSGMQRGQVEIILVNNGMSETFGEQLEKWVDLELHFACNRGACSARNLGASWAQAPIIGFVDDDGMVCEGYFAVALRWFTNPEILGLRARIVAHRHRYFTSTAYHYDRGPNPLPDALLTEGACLIRREAFINVGGFSENLSPHEGLELSYRLCEAYPELRLMYIPDLVLAHDYCDSWRKFLRKRVSYAQNDKKSDLYNPSFKRYLGDYHSTTFPSRGLSLDERLAAFALGLLSRSLRLAVHFSGSAAVPYANPIPGPTFLLIGAQKSGTSWLNAMLGQHPEVCLPADKELHFFSKKAIFNRGLDWYRSQFRPEAKSKAIGEATPNYFWTVQDSDEVRVNGQNMDVPRLVAECFPGLKLVVILRDPVERAVSSYLHHIRAGRVSPATSILDVADHYGILSMGFYDIHLKNWFRYFPREAFRIFIYEEALTPEQRAETLKEVFTHLGVRPDFLPNNSAQQIHARPSDFETRLAFEFRSRGWPRFVQDLILKVTPVRLQRHEDWKITLSPHEREVLREKYVESVSALETLLGRDLPWESSGTSAASPEQQP